MKLVPSNRVVIADVDKTQTKINSLIKDGPSNLQFIVDFDNTLTKTHKDGVSLDCSWGVLESYRELPSSYHDRVRAAKEKYHPIELDVSISQEEKIPIMIEWYKEANRCLAESGVKLPWLPLMVEQSNVELRDQTQDMLKTLHLNNIPMLVLSAGVGDLINHIMQHFGVLHDNTTLVSNFLKFDEEGNIVGLQGLIRFIILYFVSHFLTQERRVISSTCITRRRVSGRDPARRAVRGGMSLCWETPWVTSTWLPE